MQLNLEKATTSLKLCLEKKGVTVPPVLEVAIAMDVSGSFEDEHRSGQTSDLMQRLAPWGIAFDPDKKLDVFTFSNGNAHAHYVGELTDKNYEGYVMSQIYGRVPGWNCGTDYSYVIEKVLAHNGWEGNNPSEAPKKSGFLSRMFGGGQAPAAPAAAPVRKRTVVFFVTDGENSDVSRTQQVLKRAEQNGYEVYVMFLGISNNNVDFRAIRSYADEFQNTGFLRIKNLKQFVAQDDDVLNEQLLVPELLEWLKK